MGSRITIPLLKASEALQHPNKGDPSYPLGGYLGYILGLYWDNVKKMETTITGYIYNIGLGFSCVSGTLKK